MTTVLSHKPLAHTPLSQINIAYPPAGTQKKIEIDDDGKLCVARLPVNVRSQHTQPPQACILRQATCAGG